MIAAVMVIGPFYGVGMGWETKEPLPDVRGSLDYGIGWRRVVLYLGSRFVPMNLSSQMAMARPSVRVVKNM
jgi:hypothetical protein